jgi:hypothetical protein
VTGYVRITRLSDGDRPLIVLRARDRDRGHGWSFGAVGSGKRVELAEDGLAGTDLAILRISNHVVLSGSVPPAHVLPPFYRAPYGEWRPRIPDFPNAEHPDRFGLRFDFRPLRIGDHVVQYFDQRPADDGVDPGWPT